MFILTTHKIVCPMIQTCLEIKRKINTKQGGVYYVVLVGL